ncbi:hypothetical protein [Sphaerospermopsis sp. FACHB-1094]|uniref:hypothetical protein n=1 Tax=Sphaerospermopsis sp. FACHB-1094 TaxID=2692861 RepID=UPI001F551B5C|nr:hypothetical protein [Sphaerospermopsis sp. FACHB-1094]
MTELPSRNLPPKPPAPPAPPVATSITQRNNTQMLQNPRVGSPAGNAPPPMAAPRATVPATSKPPAGLTLAQIVQEAFDQGYSDVHLGIGEIPRFRNRGEIQVTNYPETDDS